jgi:hypothetical protein
MRWYMPTLQLVHWLLVSATPVEYEPAAQAVHWLRPSMDAKVPATQFWHMATVRAPVAVA